MLQHLNGSFGAVPPPPPVPACHPLPSMYPMLRFDTRLPLKPWHKWQHIYIWIAYPYMHLAFQLGDFSALLNNRTIGAELLGATWGGMLGWEGGVTG